MIKEQFQPNSRLNGLQSLKPFLLIIGLLSGHFFAFGQERKSNHSHFINVGYDQIGALSFVKTGYKISFRELTEFEHNFGTLSADIGFSDKYFAPSLTYNFYGLFYYAGINTTLFINAHTNDFRLAPQIGLTYFSVLNIGYSYSFAFTSTSQSAKPGHHCFNVTLSLPI